MVVDAGPDPAAMDACLDRLEVEEVPLLLLTHFHADHVDGVGGVLEGREVGVVEGTGLLDPVAGVEAVETATGRDADVAAYGGTRRFGDVTLQALWPPREPAARTPARAPPTTPASWSSPRSPACGCC